MSTELDYAVLQLRQREHNARADDASNVKHPTACGCCGRRVMAQGAAYLGGAPNWRLCSAHADVMTDEAGTLGDLLGEPVEPEDVPRSWRLLMFARSGARADADVSGDRDRRKPWQHVDGYSLERLRDDLAEVRASRVPRPHTGQTGCAGCGVATSLQWYDVGGLRFRGGLPAALCGDCLPTWEAAGSPTWAGDETWARWVAADAVGVRLPPLLNHNLDGVQPFAMAATDDDRGGYPVRFDYVDEATLGRVRARVLGVSPQYARPDLPAEVLALARADWEAAQAEWARLHPPEPVHPLA